MGQFQLSRMRRKLDEAEGYLLLDLPLRTLEILQSFDDWATMRFDASRLEGEALRMVERYREALAALETAEALRPGDIRVAIALGWCYKRTHRLAQAIDALKSAVRRHPEVGLLHYNLACYWSLLNDSTRAVAHLSKAFDLDAEFRSMVASEPDFDPIRGQPAFDRLIVDPAPTT